MDNRITIHAVENLLHREISEYYYVCTQIDIVRTVWFFIAHGHRFNTIFSISLFASLNNRQVCTLRIQFKVLYLFIRISKIMSCDFLLRETGLSFHIFLQFFFCLSKNQLEWLGETLFPSSVPNFSRFCHTDSSAGLGETMVITWSRHCRRLVQLNHETWLS